MEDSNLIVSITYRQHLKELQEVIEAFCASQGIAAPPRACFDPTRMHFCAFDPEAGFKNGNFYQLLGTCAHMPVTDEQLEARGLPSIVEILQDKFFFPWHVNGNTASGNFGAVIIPYRHGKFGTEFLFLREWRLPVGAFVWNVPRGFPAKVEKSLGTALRELGEETSIEVELQMQLLGSLYENTGYSRNEVSVFSVEIPRDVDIKTEMNAVWRFMTEEQYIAEASNQGFDSFTLAALSLFRSKNR